MQIINSSLFAQTLSTAGSLFGAAPAVDSNVLSGAIKTIEKLCTSATNKALPPARDAASTTCSSPKSDKVIEEVSKLYGAQVAPSISLTLVGETHRNDVDEARANSLIQEVVKDRLLPTVIVLERGLEYQVGGVSCQITREKSLTTILQNGAEVDFGLTLSAKQRSIVVAAYIYLCLASGNQNTADKVLIFFGENHSDILTSHFEYFVRHTTSTWMQNRPRSLMMVRSSVR